MKLKLILTSMMLMALMSCEKEQKELKNEKKPKDLKISVNAVPAIPVWGGGVFGLAGLSIADNSYNFRAKGGDLFIHGVGWNNITANQKNQILTIFTKTGMGIEIGYNTNPSLQVTNYNNLYGAYDITPSFVTVNCFALQNVPTLQGWQNYVNAFRSPSAAGIQNIFPTFEYANIRSDAEILANFVSDNTLFQNMIIYSGGLTLDVPAKHYFERTNAYRSWVLDAIKWAKARNKIVYLITSPKKDASTFNYETNRLYNALVAANALPTGFISENYNSELASEGQVSPESVDGSSLFVGKTLLNK